MLRYHAGTLIDRAHIPSALLAARNSTGLSPFVTVLAYHRVAPSSVAADFDEGTVNVSPEAFDRHVAYVKKYFDVIGIDDLLGFVRGGPLPKNPLLITFDDGYLDNWKTAVPILKKHGAKATFFFATTYITDRRIFWWDRINYMVKRSKRDSIEIDYPTRTVVSLADKKKAFRTLRYFITDHFGIDIWRFLDVVGEACGVVITREEERRLADDMILTWDDVLAIQDAGIDVQSHTCDHYVLTTLDEAGLKRELGQSREILEGKLKRPVRAITYPVGRGVAARPELRKSMKESGYELGFSNASGINHRFNLDPLDVKRLSLDYDVPDGYFKTVLAVPYLRL